MNTLFFITDYVMTSSMVNAMMTAKNSTAYVNYLSMASNAMNNTMAMAQQYRMPLSYMMASFMENVTSILTKMERNNETWIILYPITLFLTAMIIQYVAARPPVVVPVPENILQDAMVKQKRYRTEYEQEMSPYGDHPMMRRSMNTRVFYMLS